MSEHRIRARFIGKDGSLGYRNGQVYELVLRGNDIVRPTPCPYSSVEAFLRNWQQLATGEQRAVD